MSDFFARFEAARADAEPQSLQLLFFEPPSLEADAVARMLNALPGVQGATCEWATVTGMEQAHKFGDGPNARALGLVTWADHMIKLAVFDAPMPYGPVESCVGPALLPPPMKVDAAQHKAHALLYYAGANPDPLERFAALCAVAGALARFDAIAVLNEEARTAAPAFDLIPDDGEDALATYRSLPIPYLLGGFVKLNVGDAERPWVRSFANFRLSLPELAMKLESHAETAETFKLFAGILGYLRSTGEKLEAGETLDLGDDRRFALRSPSDTEWYLEAKGTMLVIETGSG